MNTGRTQRLACLLAVLRAGESLAAVTAAQQARLAPLPWMRRALAIQAAQERQHAALADAAIRVVGVPAAVPDVTGMLRARLQHDLAAGDLAASFIGLQGVIEHLGEALLEFLAAHAHPAGALLHPLRRHVLAQERGHVRLGACCRAVIAPPLDAQACASYHALGLDMANQVAALLDDSQLHGTAFWQRVHPRLAAWQADDSPPAP